MSSAARTQLEACVERFRRGELTEADLRRALDALRPPASGDGGGGPRQDLLYLQTRSTSPVSEVIGMMMLRRGELDQGPADPAAWPYGSVAAALADGWRVIRFPDPALMMDDRNTYGLGCEFILEKWS